MHKTKLTLKLDVGQACVVADVEYFKHIIEVYKAYAEEASTVEEKEMWMVVPTLISEWVEKTLVVEEDIDVV